MTHFKPFLLILVCLVAALALPMYAQTDAQNSPAAAASPAATAQTRSIGDVLSDPNNITFLTFLGANIADAKTDWHITGPITHKEYTFTPAQRLSISLGTAAMALYLREQFPCLKKPVSVVMGILTAYFAGRALANTYNHSPGGAAASPTPAAIPAPKVAFAVQIRR